MFIILFISFRLRLENFLIYLIFAVNAMHLLQTAFGYRSPLFYNFINSLLLPSLHTGITEFGQGGVGHYIFLYTGLYFTRLTILFDQPSTYFLLITLLSFVLMFQKKHKFSFVFIIAGFFACPTKVGLVLIPLYLFIYLFRKKYNFSRRLQVFLIAGGIFTLTFLPFIIGYLGNVYYDNNVVHSYNSSIESRIYWTWLYGNGYMPWEVIDKARGNFNYGTYDGIAAGFPFLLASILAWFIAPKVRHYTIALILTNFISVQYGTSMTSIWAFFVLSLSLKELFESEKECEIVTTPLIAQS